MTDLEKRLIEIADVFGFQELVTVLRVKPTKIASQSLAGFGAIVGAIVSGRFHADDGQDVIVTLLNKIQKGMAKEEGGFYEGQFPLQSKFDAFVWVCLNNTSQKRMRKSNNGRKTIDNLKLFVNLTEAPAQTPIEQQEIIDRALQPCLDGLDPLSRRILLAVHRDGRSRQEVAEQEDISEETVRQRLRRARLYVRECMASRGVSGEDLTFLL